MAAVGRGQGTAAPVARRCDQDRRAGRGQGRQGRRTKYATDRPYADPEKAARRILELANGVEPIQGRIHIEKINGPFLFLDRGSPADMAPA